MASTPTSKLFQLQLQNVKLRKAVAELSRRQEVLEEFIDCEPEIAAEFKLFKFNRDRMMFALGYTLEDILLQYGKRSPKSLELVRLMRIVKTHQRPAYEKKVKRRREIVHPKELKHLGLFVNKNTGKLQRNPAQKCKKCHDPQHGFKRCPYRYEASRTPEVKAMIQERIDRLKKYELNDPFIPNSYKKRNFGVPVTKAAQALKWRRLEEEHMAIMKGMEASSGQTLSTSAAARLLNSVKTGLSGRKGYDDEDEDDDEEEQDDKE